MEICKPIVQYIPVNSRVASLQILQCPVAKIYQVSTLFCHTTEIRQCLYTAILRKYQLKGSQQKCRPAENLNTEKYSTLRVGNRAVHDI